MCLLQTAVNDQMEETSSKGLTEATFKEHRMQRISAHICVLREGYVKAICLLAVKKLPHSFTHPLYAFLFFFFFVFLLFSFSSFLFFLWLRLLAQFRKCGDAQLVGVFCFLTASSSKRLFAFHRPLLPLSTQTPSQTWPVTINCELLNFNSP